MVLEFYLVHFFYSILYLCACVSFVIWQFLLFFAIFG